MSIKDGFMLYLETKKNLRPESLRDIRYLGSRLIKSNSKFGETYFSELKPALCEQYLSSAFKTPSQFNKARTMLYGLFEFALKREWCDKNPIKLIEKQKVIEKEIIPLSNTQTESLLKSAENTKKRDCLPAVGLLLFAGIRPREVRRLKWKDIDLEEGFITVRSQCSKTGGVRHVEIMPALKQNIKAMGNPQYARQTGIENGKISARNRDLRALGFKTFCGILTQAILLRDIETCRDCS